MLSLALLFTLLAAADESPPLRGHDPYVFRCTLDRKPRMLVVALSPGWWLAFDTQTCRVHKVWEGAVDFTGPVYDTRHGPQPAAIGDIALQGGDLSCRAGLGENNEQWLSVTTRWRGYRFDSTGNVVLAFDVAVPNENDDAAKASRVVHVEISPTFKPFGRRSGRLSFGVKTDLPEKLRLFFRFVPLDRACTPDFTTPVMMNPFGENEEFWLSAGEGETQLNLEIEPR